MRKSFISKNYFDIYQWGTDSATVNQYLMLRSHHSFGDIRVTLGTTNSIRNERSIYESEDTHKKVG